MSVVDNVAVHGKPSTAAGERYDTILLASEGRPITDAAIDRVMELANPGATVRVFATARIHGVSFGLQTPGLMPTKQEWADQRASVAKAVKRLKRKGFNAEGEVFATRKATKRICEAAVKAGCEAIVMGADSDRNRWAGDFMWTQEPQRVRRRASLPVFLVHERGA